jgi:hypothetical protein
VRRKFTSLVQPCLGVSGEAALFDVAMNLDSRSVADLLAATMPCEPLRAAAAG